MSDPTRHYDQVTEAWGLLMGENLHYGFFSAAEQSLEQATAALTDQMLALAELQPGQRVLDVGCGTGAAACRIAAECECPVLGISPSRASVEAATRRATGAGLGEQTDFAIGDGQVMDVADATFDCTWVMESSHLMLDKVALLRECSRVLRPGGRLVLCDVIAGKALEMTDVIAHRDAFLLLQEGFGRARMEPLDYYREQLSAAGFVVDVVRDISLETRPTFTHWRNNALEHQAAVEAMIGRQGWQVFHDCCAVLETFWDQGLLGYGLLSASKPA